ncbi:hypothetical protein PYV00_03675 [Novosphingobium sp. H3SJ31-1]|uniref:DUF3617 family protein n=2 Tax=Novosphingobium album (ex Liu et al. 2023) TaxID=3031130 RepID=A0ABT5WLA4_9SPHN|nr:hypothetical protein [Novosphingobium album (ex Liu et al. 2023)]MDE8650820.1 hypothetical protein [Novosphingobium album (ex Liu et al. 2023)]
MCLVSAAPVPVEKPVLTMLDHLDRGNWELRVRGDEARVERICLDNGRRLIQLRHPQLRCEQVVLDDGASEVTVQYTCKGQGYGRTHIRRETNSLVQIDSQGIANGFPFSFAAEARRTGECRG